ELGILFCCLHRGRQRRTATDFFFDLLEIPEFRINPLTTTTSTESARNRERNDWNRDEKRWGTANLYKDACTRAASKGPCESERRNPPSLRTSACRRSTCPRPCERCSPSCLDQRSDSRRANPRPCQRWNCTSLLKRPGCRSSCPRTRKARYTAGLLKLPCSLR